MSFSKHDLSSCTRGLSSPSFPLEVLRKKYLRSMVKSWILPAMLFCESVHSQPTSPGINIKAWQPTRALSSTLCIHFSYMFAKNRRSSAEHLPPGQKIIYHSYYKGQSCQQGGSMCHPRWSPLMGPSDTSISLRTLTAHLP